MIYIQKILALAMIMLSSVVIHLDPSNHPVGILGIIWGWDILFNRPAKAPKSQKYIHRKLDLHIGGNQLLGIAGEDLRCGECVVIGEDGKIHKARSGQ